MAAGAYDDLIMEHIRNARGYRVLADATHQTVGANPLCGDELTVYVKLDGERIADLSFQCECCGISMASSSLMCESLQGKNRADVLAWIDDFAAAIVAHAEPPAHDADALRHALLKTVRELPARTTCAALPWATLSAALQGRAGPVTVPVR